MNNIIKSWNSRVVRIREDRYVSLTDMAQATGEKLNSFLESKRALSIIFAFYKAQTGIVRHPVIEDDCGDVWVCIPLAREFSYQSQNYAFSIWIDDILWADVLHPEILPIAINNGLKRHKYKEIDLVCQTATTFVYFVLNTATNTVKIGYSKNPEARMKCFASGTLDKLILLKTIPGGIETEKELHDKFAKYRVSSSREIFHYKGALKAYIESLA